MTSKKRDAKHANGIIDKLALIWLAYKLPRRVIKKDQGQTVAVESAKPPFYGPPSSLQLRDILDIAFKLGNHVDRLWNMYLIASAAAIGWVITAKGDWGPGYKLAVFFIYLAFSIVNGCNLYRMYRWLSAALKDLNNEVVNFDGVNDSKSKLKSAMRVGRIPGRGWLEAMIYLLVFALVTYSILYLPVS